MAVSLTCTRCNVTSQRPRESARICPRCDYVESLARFIPEVDGETPAQNIRNAMQTLQFCRDLSGNDEQLSVSSLAFSQIMSRLHTALTQLERI